MKKLLLVASLTFLAAACEPKTVPNAAKPETKGSNNATATHEATPNALKPGRVDPGSVPLETKMRASRGAKDGVIYTNALAALYAPEDQKDFSAYDEYGWKKEGEFKTYGPQPAGWWVYSAPYWIVWDLKNGARGE